jgi:hypothetical protein
MTGDRTAGLLLIAGSVVFLVGAAVGVPRVFTEPAPQARLRLLTEHPAMWRAAQPLYGLGAIIAAAGVGWLAAAAATPGTRAALAVACLALAVGALAWAWSLYLRATRIAEFAFGKLPGWPFATYVLLTIGGLALLGAGLLAARYPAWLGWLTLGTDLLFLTGYLWLGDIPPFVLYLLLLLIGVVLW